jgi:chromosome segregation ATPase
MCLSLASLIYQKTKETEHAYRKSAWTPQANNTARELQKRVEHLEKVNIDIKTRLDETVVLYETSQRDLRTKITEIQRITHELDKTREQKDVLTRENKKLSGKWQ